ncbi:restriction endonuclease subunit S [Kurthia gibsonii]|uniref:restriction endonuclease subunit S n=1 Tax=Kurthia gibsonii TaxID=33946 RepID=UPI0030D5A9AB
MEFNKYTVNDLVKLNVLEKPLDGNHGGIHPRGADFIDNGIPFITASDIKGNEIDFRSCKYISLEQAEQLKKGKAQENDVLITHKATIGRTAIVPKIPFPYIVLSPQVTFYRVKNYSILNNLYLKYFFDSSEFQNTFLNWSGGGSTRLYLGISAQGKLPITIPSITTQEKIVSVINKLELKIKNNKKLLINLEQLAQTLFKHWFIDFEFPNEEGKPYKSSGGEMVKSELGEIPRDWQYLKLGELDCTISDHVANGSFKSLKDNVVFTELIDERYALFARNIDLKKKLSGDLKYITKDSYDFLKKSHLFGGEIIVSNVGDVGTIHRCPTLNIPMVLGNNQIYITSKKEFFNEYLYLLLKSNVGKSLISSITSGSVQMKFNKTDFRNSKIILPSDDLLKRIFSKIKIDLDLIEVLNNENKYLQHLRDTLLPKLLSGEIEIPDDLEV